MQYRKYLKQHWQQDKTDTEFGFSSQKLPGKRLNLDIKNFLLHSVIDQDVAISVLKNNACFAHPESALLALLSGVRETVVKEI